MSLHNSGEIPSPPEADRLEEDFDLDVLASEWSDLNWKADEIWTLIQEAVQRSSADSNERLKQLQIELETVRGHQLRLLQRRIASENSFFASKGV